jgi:pimeloyl-ACP methyl ester carboxylesterase
MKHLLFIILFSIATKLFGQIMPDSNPATGFSVQNVQFQSTAAVLSGTLFKPKHPYAAVVLVHGSGQEKRMIRLATELAEKGLAVLTYDKRGVGESSGVYNGPEVGTNNIDSVNLNLLALDASEAINVLIAHLPPKIGTIGLIGFSQAGWIIPLAAQKNPKIKYMILFSGPVVTTLEQLRFQFYTQGDTKFWDTHTEAQARDHIQNDPDKYQFAPIDPADALAQLKIPGLWIFGGKDIQAPVGLSIANMNKLKVQGKDYEYRLFPELGHNTAFSKTAEPVNLATQWIKELILNKDKAASN